MAGMIDLVREGYFPEGSNVLYAHLGGKPRSTGTPPRSTIEGINYNSSRCCANVTRVRRM